MSRLSWRTSPAWRGIGLALCLQLCAAAAVAQVSAQVCGLLHLPTQNRPWDYRYDKQWIAIVEKAHFTPSVEALVKGKSTELPGADIHYTLVTFPNHPRALLAVARLGKKKLPQAQSGLGLPVECYFERAIRFASDDMLMRLLYARYLGDEGRKDEALAQVEVATREVDGSPLTQRNAGLVLLELGAFERALAQSHKLLSVWPDEDLLSGELKKAGHWREPAATPPPSAAATAAATAATPAASAP